MLSTGDIVKILRSAWGNGRRLQAAAYDELGIVIEKASKTNKEKPSELLSGGSHYVVKFNGLAPMVYHSDCLEKV